MNDIIKIISGLMQQNPVRYPISADSGLVLPHFGTVLANSSPELANSGPVLAHPGMLQGPHL